MPPFFESAQAPLAAMDAMANDWKKSARLNVTTSPESLGKLTPFRYAILAVAMSAPRKRPTISVFSIGIEKASRTSAVDTTVPTTASENMAREETPQPIEMCEAVEPDLAKKMELAVIVSASAATWSKTETQRFICEPSPVRTEGTSGTRPKLNTGEIEPSDAKYPVCTFDDCMANTFLSFNMELIVLVNLCNLLCTHPPGTGNSFTIGRFRAALHPPPTRDRFVVPSRAFALRTRLLNIYYYNAKNTSLNPRAFEQIQSENIAFDHTSKAPYATSLKIESASG